MQEIITDVVQVNVMIENNVVNQESFDLAGYYTAHDVWPQWVKVISDPSELVDAGMPLSHQAYRWAQVFFSQSPRPSALAILRKSDLFDHSVRATVLSVGTVGDTAEIRVLIAGAWVTFSYEIQALDDAADVAAGLSALVAAAAGVASTASLATFTMVCDTPGETLAVEVLRGDIHLEDVTPSTGVTADFTAIRNESDAFYVVSNDLESAAEISAIAAATSALDKIYEATTSQHLNLTATTGNLGASLKALAYSSMDVGYHPDVGSNLKAGKVGRQITRAIGSTTPNGKQFVGVRAYKLSLSQINNLKTNRINYYTEKKGGGFYVEGIAPNGEFVTNESIKHWIRARVEEEVIGFLRATENPGYDDEGFASLAEAMGRPFIQMTDVGGFLADPSFSITTPKRASISPQVAQTRVVPGIKGRAYLRGAIHAVKPVDIVLTVALPA